MSRSCPCVGERRRTTSSSLQRRFVGKGPVKPHNQRCPRRLLPPCREGIFDVAPTRSADRLPLIMTNPAPQPARPPTKAGFTVGLPQWRLALQHPTAWISIFAGFVAAGRGGPGHRAGPRRGAAVSHPLGRADAHVGHRWWILTASRASASERNQRTFITMKVRSSYCSASRIQSFISSESRALISLTGR